MSTGGEKYVLCGRKRKEAQKWGICKDKIVRSDIQMVGKIEQTLEKIRKEIAQNSHELKELNKKKMKNVTQQDIDNK